MRRDGRREGCRKEGDMGGGREEPMRREQRTDLEPLLGRIGVRLPLQARPFLPQISRLL